MGIDIGMYIIYIYVSRLDISNFYLCSQKFYYQLLSEADMYSPQNHLDCTMNIFGSKIGNSTFKNEKNENA